MPALDITTVSNEALVKKVIFLAIQYGGSEKDYQATQHDINALRQQVELGEAEIVRRLELKS